MSEKVILDPCCGGRMFYRDKNNPAVLYGDIRNETHTLCDGRVIKIKPDAELDFTALSYPDETFYHVIFDPPHLIGAGVNSWMVKRYGKLSGNWKPMIRDGFNECYRVLKLYGTLIFKWSENSVTVGEVIKAIGREPLYGQLSRRGCKTHWMAFVKLPEEENYEHH